MTAETIPALLVGWAQRHPGKDAIVGDDARIDYAGLDAASRALAASLVDAGVNKGHRVGLMMPNGVDWAAHACAVMRIGAVLVPLSTLLRPAELASQLRIAGVRHLIVAPSFRDRDYRAEFAEIDCTALPSLTNLWWSDAPLPQASSAALAITDALTASVRPADEMAVIFTSGSSGEPKGVIHTHGAAIRASAGGQEVRCITPDTRLYLPMPLFWAGGFATGLISALNAGCTLLTEAAPKPEGTLRFVAENGVTLFRGWPDQAERIASSPAFARTDLSALRPGSLDALMPGESPAPGARAPLLGMTESFGPYCGYALDRLLPREKWGSCGKALPGRKVRIVDLETGSPLPAGATGAIQIGGPDILKGICGKEREQVFTVDGWYDTGDLGSIDADGFLFFAGRGDDMVKVRGASVWPSEVEAVLCALPGVDMAVACGLERDGRTVLAAAVVAGCIQAPPARIAQDARTRLSAFKVPTHWLVLESRDDLPLTTSGKVDRGRVREMLERGAVSLSAP